MRPRGRGTVLANPVLVGAVTILVIAVAVFLAYNANRGLPFVPSFELHVDAPNGGRLVPGNDVREGGNRIGAVQGITPRPRPDGTLGAEIVLKLDQRAAPIPADSTVVLRPRSALGLKYVEFNRGSAADTLPDGATITVGSEALAPELQEFFNLFDKRTRDNVQANLIGYGDGFAWRGQSLNRALERLPAFLRAAPPVMNVLADPQTRLARLFEELGDAARVTAPVADTAADGFRAGADTFEALSGDPGALQQTIAESPATLAVGTSALRNTRPFLRSFAAISSELRAAGAELRRSTPPITSALRSGVDPLNESPALNRRLRTSFTALTALAKAPGSDRGVMGLNETMAVLNPLLRFLAPYQTVCNYWNYSWTALADHITDQDQTGQVQRIRVKEPSSAENSPLSRFGRAYPIPTLHAQTYAAAIGPNGEADCESGQRGFPRHLAEGVDPDFPVAVDPVTPGLQGPTFKGRARVPQGQTYAAEPEGAPKIRVP